VEKYDNIFLKAVQEFLRSNREKLGKCVVVAENVTGKFQRLMTTLF
jgi:hypothetical protein